MLWTLWFVIIFVLVIWVWPMVWAAGVRGRIDILAHFPRHECDIGEAIPLTVTLINRSWLPLPYAEVIVNLPPELSVRADVENTRLSFATYLLGRRRVQIEFNLYGYRRGPAAIKDVFAKLHEGLSLRNVYVYDAYDQPISSIAVRPDRDGAASTENVVSLQGEHAVDRWLFPDETMFKGVRPYQSTDSSRHIHWRASARLGQTMTKQFFSSTVWDVMLVLNAQTSDPHWAGTVRGPFEQFCKEATSAACRLEKRGARLMFATNAIIVGQRGAVMDRMNSRSIRSLLAHAHPYAVESFTVLLRQLSRRRLGTPQQIVLFSAFETPEQQRLIEQLKRMGKTIRIIRSPLNSENTQEEVREE